MQQINVIKSQLRPIQHDDEYRGVLPMDERGINYQKLTSEQNILLMEWPTCFMQLYTTADQSEDKLYRRFIFDK